MLRLRDSHHIRYMMVSLLGIILMLGNGERILKMLWGQGGWYEGGMGIGGLGLAYIFVLLFFLFFGGLNIFLLVFLMFVF